MARFRRLAFLGCVLILVTAACGGDDASTEATSGDAPGVSSTPAAATATTAAPAMTTTQPAQSDDPGTGVTESRATVSVGGAVYEFDANGPVATCNPDFFGGFTAILYGQDQSEVFSVTLWNEGTGDGQQDTTSYLKMVVDGEVLDLEANPESSWPAAAVGSSYVDPFSYEGNHASGVVYFINAEVAYDESLAPLDTVVAEFDIVCASE